MAIVKKLQWLFKGLRYHPRNTVRLILSTVDSELKISEHSRITNKGERIIIQGDWDHIKRHGNFIELCHLQRYEWVIGLVNEGKIRAETLLDVGCGTGYGVYKIAKDTKIPLVMGVDISKRAIENFAHKYYSLPNLWFNTMDACELALNFPTSFFDVVTLFEIVEHLSPDKQHEVLGNVTNVLRPEGVALLSMPNAYVSEGNNPHHQKELSCRELKNLAKSYFTEVQIFGQDIVLDGKRAQENWQRHAEDVTTIQDLGIFDDYLEKSFDLLAICKEPRKRKYSRVLKGSLSRNGT